MIAEGRVIVMNETEVGLRRRFGTQPPVDAERSPFILRHGDRLLEPVDTITDRFETVSRSARAPQGAA